jgi:tetratricopeptide (TPR) repeat protein
MSKKINTKTDSPRRASDQRKKEFNSLKDLDNAFLSLYHSKKYDRLVDLAIAGLMQYPTEPICHKWMMVGLLQSQRYSHLIEAYDNALANCSLYQDVWQWHYYKYRGLMGMGLQAEAHRFIANLLKQEPSPNDIIKRFEELMRTAKTSWLNRMIHIGLTEYPEMEGLWRLLLSQLQDDQAEAETIAWLQEQIKTNPFAEVQRYYLGLIYEMVSKPADATLLFETLVHINLTEPLYHQALIQNYLSLEQLDQAEAAIEVYSHLVDDTELLRRFELELFVSQGKYTHALDCIMDIEKQTNLCAENLFLKMRCHLFLGQYDEAIEVIDYALSHDVKDCFTFTAKHVCQSQWKAAMAQIMAEKGNHQQSANWYLKAADNAPDSIDFWMLAGHQYILAACPKRIPYLLKEAREYLDGKDYKLLEESILMPKHLLN